MVAFADRDTSSVIQCRNCGVTYSLLYNHEDMVDWLSGSIFIQDAMPYLSPSERELLISGICGDCFDEIFVAPDLDFTK